VCIVLFLPDVVVLGSNPFCISSLEQNDLFLTQLFGFNLTVLPRFWITRERIVGGLKQEKTAGGYPSG
jgi:hypothetical protein